MEEPITGPWVEKGQQESVCFLWLEVIWPHCHGEQHGTPWKWESRLPLFLAIC